MLTYIITGDNVLMDGDLRAYIEKRFAGFERFTGRKAVEELHIVASKTTAHNRDDMYKVEARFGLYKQTFFASIERSDLYEAVDMVKDELMQEVVRSKQKRRTLFERGARTFKSLARGMRDSADQLRKARSKSI